MSVLTRFKNAISTPPGDGLNALASRWVAEAEALTLADDPDKAAAKRDRRIDAVLADANADEFQLVQAAVDADDGTWKGQAQQRAAHRRLRTGPVPPVDPAIERELLELVASDATAIVRIRQRRPGSTYPLDAAIELEVGERAKAMTRLLRNYRRQRAAQDERDRQSAAAGKVFDDALDEMRAALDQTGDWQRLLAGSPVVIGWLHSEHFATFAAMFEPGWKLTPATPRRLLLELAGTERGR